MDFTSKKFEGILEGYFEQYLEEHPQMANVAGLRWGEGKLGRNNSRFEKKWYGKKKQTLRKLEEISPRELSREQHLDRLALRSQLRREVEDYELGRHAMDPGATDAVLH